MPIEILAVEMKQLYEQRSCILGEQEELKKIMRQDSLQRWQEKWDASEKGRWTHLLIPQVDNWVNRKHREVNYYLTQMLSNHGWFRAYFYRFKHEEAPQCQAGCGVPEDAEHVFFWCQHIAGERKELEDTLGSTPELETLVKLILTTEEKWSAVSGFTTTVMKRLREEEQERRKTRRPTTTVPRNKVMLSSASAGATKGQYRPTHGYTVLTVHKAFLLSKKKKHTHTHTYIHTYIFQKPCILIPNTSKNNYNMFLQQLKKLLSQSFL